jgi:hypothetical protein
MNVLAPLAMVVGILCAPVTADAQGAAPDQPVRTWERGKDGENPLDALAKMANLPRGVPGQSREELRALLVAADARIVSEDASRIVARGKMSNGVELKADFVYNFEDGLFVAGNNTVSGAPVGKSKD